jgi:hypothetical protein
VFQVLQGLALGGCSWIMGFTAGRTLPSARATGRWLWLLPTGLFLYMFLGEISSAGLRIAILGFISSAYHGNGEASFLIYLATYPAWSSLCYSLAIAMAGRKRRTHAEQGG